MKIEKYVFYYHKANDLYSRKYGSPRPLNHCETFCLYAVRHLSTARMATIMAHADKCHYTVSYVWVKKSILFLLAIGFVQREGMTYSLSYKGRDYLYGVRRYMMHKRL